tara:strand:- start:253 stop:693 length:441 start_codon:yes stop_codon:yes gene_type:complete
MNTKSLSFWSDFRPHTIGFDNIFDNLDYLRTVPNNNYPPYNIRKINDTHWAVDIALAGFSKEDIQVEHKPDENSLVIKSVMSKDEKDVEDNDGILHRGISKRQFTRSFSIADDVLVKSAKLENGMLSVELERIIPEEKKPKIIDIK